MQISKRAYHNNDTQLPNIHDKFHGTTLDTQGKSFLEFYMEAAGLQLARKKKSELPTNVHYLYCTSLPRAQAQYPKKNVAKEHQQVKLLALEQLDLCMPEVAQICHQM